MAHQTKDTANQFIRKNIMYPFKRRFGLPATIFQLDIVTNDVETGVQTKFYNRFKIKKVILLPRNLIRKFVYDLSYIAANKNFTYGGLFDFTNRIILIDGRDIKFKPNPNDHIEIEGVRENIKKVEEFEHASVAWIIGTSRIEGEPPTPNISTRGTLSHTLEFTDIESVVVT